MYKIKNMKMIKLFKVRIKIIIEFKSNLSKMN